MRAAVQHLNNNSNTYTLDATGKPILDTLGASNYTSDNKVYAAYVTFTSAIKNFSYSVGLRGESSSYNGKLLNTTPNQHFSNSYPLSLFPSIFLSQKFNHDQELQF